MKERKFVVTIIETKIETIIINKTSTTSTTRKLNIAKIIAMFGPK